MKALQPDGWKRPSGYANGVTARGTIIFVAGQIGWNAEETFESDSLTVQVRQALLNVCAVLAVGDARPEHIVRMTWFVKDKREYLAEKKSIGEVYREVIGATYPATSLVQVADLLEDRAKVEIEVTAVIPD